MDQENRTTGAAEQAAAMVAAAGMPRMPARVMMALVAAPADGCTAADLAAQLGVSAAAVSGAVRYLQTTNIAHRISRPGERRDRYELTPDTWRAVLASSSPLYERLAVHLDRIADEHAAEEAAHRRAREMAGFFHFMGRRMPALLDEWEIERATAAGS